MKFLYAPRCNIQRFDSLRVTHELANSPSFKIGFITDLEQGKEFLLITERIKKLIPSIPLVLSHGTNLDKIHSSSEMTLWVSSNPPQGQETVLFLYLVFDYSLFWGTTRSYFSPERNISALPYKFVAPPWKYPISLVPESSGLLSSTASNVSQYQQEVIDQAAFGIAFTSALEGRTELSFKTRRFQWKLPVFLTNSLYSKKGVLTLLRYALNDFCV